MNTHGTKARGRMGRLAVAIAMLTWLATVHGAEAGHPPPNIPGLRPLATAFATFLGAVVLLGSVVVVVIIATRPRPPR